MLLPVMPPSIVSFLRTSYLARVALHSPVPDRSVPFGGRERPQEERTGSNPNTGRSMTDVREPA